MLHGCIAALAAAEEAPFLATALEVVSRASTSSEVLSLNLTNLIILIALKVSSTSTSFTSVSLGTGLRSWCNLLLWVSCATIILDTKSKAF